MLIPIAYEEDFPDSPNYNPNRRAQQQQQQQEQQQQPLPPPPPPQQQQQQAQEQQQQQPQQQQPQQTESGRLREEAMRHMVLVWHKLVRADEEEAATAAENFGKELFGEERFQDAMTAAVMGGGDSEPDVGQEV